MKFILAILFCLLPNFVLAHSKGMYKTQAEAEKRDDGQCN